MEDELAWPLRGWEAVEAGMLSVRVLRRFYSPVYPGVHIPRDAELSAAQRARAAWLWSRRSGVLAGLSAAAILGTKWIEPGLPAELIHTNRRAPPMLIVHTDDVLSGETRCVDGMLVSSAARTAFDVGRRLELVAGVQRVDALMNAVDVKVSDIESVAVAHPGVRGLKPSQAKNSHTQLAWPSRTSSELTDPWISSTVMPTSRWSRHAPSTSR